MKLQRNRIYVNKTWRFLAPCLRDHGSEFVKKYNPAAKLALGIYDELLSKARITTGRNIYTVFDKKKNATAFRALMDYVRGQPFFKGDYCPDSDMINTYLHCLVIEIPEEYYDAYDKFLQSKYSEMYTPRQLKYLFSSKQRQEEYSILSKTGEAFTKFKKTIEEEFGEKANENSAYNSEWELPLKKKEEIFNCESEDRIFFDKDLDKIWK